ETDTTAAETLPFVETGATLAEPEETVDMTVMMEEASISVISQDGMLGEFDFFTCNETQLFGDYSIRLAEYDGEEYLMLSGGGIALLAKEDGDDAMLFYNDQRLELPFPCYFNLDYEFLALYPGDFLRNGGHQLALVIPMETGSGVDVDQLQIIDLDTMSLVPLHTQKETYEKELRGLFDAHFAQVHPGLEYQLFQFIQYHIEDGLIFAEYGACDEDGNYLCFLEATLSYNGSMVDLDADMTFQDHMR
ncbi:MAG: hypothetical protein J6I64_00545, partial [Lachnospiraceae bacterium]|nr:hypothetical protein [Lachnospiraceae bacterium]